MVRRVALRCTPTGHSVALFQLKFGLLIKAVRRARGIMSNDNGRWDLDVLGRQVGPHKNGILERTGLSVSSASMNATSSRPVSKLPT